jgi:protein TonB
LDAVAEILAERGRERAPWEAGLAGTIALHGMAAALLILAARSAPPHPFAVPNAVSVRLVPIGSLQPASPSQAAPPPEASPRPRIEKLEETPAPTAKALPTPEKQTPRKPPAPSGHGRNSATSEPSPAVSLPGSNSWKSEGVPEGSTFGTSVSAFDSADFNYSYYEAQMLATIGANWFKETSENVPSPVVGFRIGRDGTITDVRIEKSSGLPFVDRAAQRAVMTSSPLPPLPADFHDAWLGVHIKFN